jgi:serine/threonine protein phosphatase PrpC
MKFSPGNAQHIGARADQQDSFGFSDPSDKSFVAHAGISAVVADGMGGLANGSVASSAAVNAFLKAYESKEPAESIPEALLRSIQSANQAVTGLCRGESAKENPGTTLAAVVLHGDWLYWVSAGDSRVYFYQDGRLVRLTSDHVYAADLDEQVRKGRITLEQAINHPEREALTSYLGLQTLPHVDRSVRAFPVKPGDCVLICSDGLYRSLSDDEIAVSLEKDARRVCEDLVERAVAKQIARQDNITVIALKCREESTATPVMKVLAWTAVLAALIVGAFVFWRRSIPSIGEFAVDRPQIQTGQSAVLHWSVNKGTVTIVPGIGRIDQSTGARSVSPAQKTTYTLTARNIFGSVQRSIDIDVRRPPESASLAPRVTIFHADPAVVQAGGAVKLSWKVEGKTSEIRLNGEKVEPIGSRTIPNVRAETTYRLTATGPQGKAMQDLRVSVSANEPRISMFQATPDRIAAGASAMLKWSVGNAVAIHIDPAPGGAVLQAVGAQRVRPAATTTYTMTATGRGAPAIEKVTVTVAPSRSTPVKIAAFGSDKSEILGGGAATLRWNVTGDILSAAIDNDIGSVKPIDSRKVTPKLKTTYTLTVTGAAGNIVTSQATVDILRPPKIEMFNAAPVGQVWRLFWQVSGADRAGTRIHIDPGIGPVASSSSPEGLPITSPSADGYILTAEGPGGTDSRHVAVQQPSGPPQ